MESGVSKIYFHKKNGIYYFSVMINGKQHHHSSRVTTLKGARVVADQFIQDQMLADLAAQQAALLPPPPPAVIVFKCLAARWEAAQDEDTSPGHIRNVRDHVRLHLVALHDLPIDQIGIEQIQPLVKAHRATHAVASTNGLRRTINLLFSYAVRAKFLKESPFHPLKKRKEPPKKRTILAEEQYGELAASVAKARNPHIPLMVAILAGTGVRRIDILHMRWEDLDIPNKIWAPVISKDGDPLVFELDEWVVEELKKLPRSSEYVFARPDGMPHGKEFLRRTLARAGRETGVGRLGTHSFRSAYITYLAEHRVPVPTIARLVGHSDVRLTMLYLARTQHALDEGMRVAQSISRAAIAKLAPALKPSEEDKPATESETSEENKPTTESEAS